MPAGLPGSTAAQNAANPSLGRFVIFDLLSGPKGSPFDKAGSSYSSTGALSTGIGYGTPPVIGPISHPIISNALAGIRRAGFTDDYIPGVSKPDGLAGTDSRFMYIGGGRTVASTAVKGVPFPPNPYTAGYGIGGAGNGGSRDAGAGPAFTGFTMKMVTAPGAVADGAAVEVGFTNRSGVALIADQSVFGSATAASAVVA